MRKPKVMIFAGFGLNCDEETKFAWQTAGGEVDIVNINDVIDNAGVLKNYQILTFQGGFAYGDDTGAGNAYARKIKNHLWEEIVSFVKKDRLVVGICNGFQIMVNLGLLPAFDGNYGSREVALLPNSSARYTVRWVDLAVVNDTTPWFDGITSLSLPIAHGEGKFYAPEKTLDKLKKKNLIALRYIKGDLCHWLSLPANPNGALNDIAGITDESGRILGLMPHPERAQFFHQLPYWTYLKDKYGRQGEKLPSEGPGLAIFKNAIKYFCR